MNIPVNFQQNRLLSELSTFGIGGPAKFFIEAHTIIEMQQILSHCLEKKIPYFILGKGSNCLFDDNGFKGLVIANRIDFFEKPAQDLFRIGAGYSFSLLGVQTARQGWSGLEFASGIPGSVGGAVYMNAGANGLETCESIVSVDYVTKEGELITLPKSKIEFKYRYSSFQTMSGAIVGVTFRLSQSRLAREKQLQIINYRKNTQPYGSKSAGCVFRNPSCRSAGALIDQIGLKGLTIGGAQVSDVHANFVINTGKATSKDVLALFELIKKEVKEKLGVELQTEVCYISPEGTMQRK